MDQRQLAAYALMVVLLIALVVFLAFWQGTGLDRSRSPGWKRLRRWWRSRLR